MNKETITTYEIEEQYKKGRRDFSNIKCNGGLLNDRDLRGIIFRNCNLEGVVFNESNLNNSDFSGSNLVWCAFRLAKLKKAKFIKCKMNLGSFQLAEFEDTDFSDSDIDDWNFIDVEKYKAKLETARLTDIMWSFSDVNAMRVENVLRKLKSTGVPLEAIITMLERIRTLKKEADKALNLEYGDSKPAYEVKINKIVKELKDGYGGVKPTYGSSSEGIYGSESMYGGKHLKPKEKKKP